MTIEFKWTNQSVLGFAEDRDPVAAMELRARKIALEAIDAGWTGPPFDPLALAQWLKIPAEARSDIADARTVPLKNGSLLLEYNPLRPRGRLRFSIAHEIAHSLFPDCAKSIRNRGGDESIAVDDWQLEVICNIGAAELLMPLGSFLDLARETLSIDNVLRLRKKFDVSTEACLLRVVKLSGAQAAVFCASEHADGKFRIDYVIPSSGWDSPIQIGRVVPKESAIKEVTAIGFTAVGNETWNDNTMRIECVGLAPYPGKITPRVVGLLFPRAKQAFEAPAIKEVTGDALSPRGTTHRIVAHVVPDTMAPWGGGGFASQVRRRFPDVWRDYRAKTEIAGRAPRLGTSVVGKLDEHTHIVHMVAQHGIGASDTQRLRYAALADCLGNLRDLATQRCASVHMPRIGTGHGGANWGIIKELIVDELVAKGIETTIYQRPADVRV